jgi:hypothetical protein
VFERQREPARPSEQPPPPELVLAATERAERHRARESRDVPAWAIVEHLGIAWRSSAARRVRSQLDALAAAGSLRRSRRNGVSTWELTAAGRRRLAGARESGELPALAESPQHLAWRNARTEAAQEIDRFGRSLGEGIEDAARLLAADPRPGSDAWFELGERLRAAARRLGSASHCLHEWVEPDDARADIDEQVAPGEERLEAGERARRRALRRGRRNLTLWEEGPRR